MEKVKRYIAKKTVGSFITKGDLFTQCFDKLYAIFNESQGYLIDVDYFDDHGGLEKYLKFSCEVEPKDSKYFINRCKELLREKVRIREKISVADAEIQKLRDRLSEIDRLVPTF